VGEERLSIKGKGTKCSLDLSRQLIVTESGGIAEDTLKEAFCEEVLHKHL
jgi:hypothetical protein